MGLTKQYLRYAETSVFGIISSQRSNILYLKSFDANRNKKSATVNDDNNTKYIVCGACEYVFVWNIKRNELEAKLNHEANKSHVTYMAQNPVQTCQLAVGYTDGTVRVFDLNKPEDGAQITFNGHKSAITCLNYDTSGIRLVSGSQDTNIVVWDIINESGLFRLRGHKGQITQALFMSGKNVLITSSKDTLVKFWDLDIRHCFKTIVLHRNEVLDMMLVERDTSYCRLITGSHDNQLRVFSLESSDAEADPNGLVDNIKKMKIGDEDEDGDEDDENNQIIKCTYMGSLERESGDKLSGLRLHSNLFVSYSANDKHFEIYKVNTEAEIRKRLAKKLKKEKKRKSKLQANVDGDDETEGGGGGGANETTAVDEDVSIERTLADEFTRVGLIKLSHKIKNVSLHTLSGSDDSSDDGHDTKCRIAVLLSNNHLEFLLYDVKHAMAANVQNEFERLGSIQNQSHSSDVRTVSFSADSSAFLSASGDSLKLWNRLSLSCIRTFKCDYACSSLFLPDSSHCMVGCKTGKIQLFDINAARQLEDIQGHGEDSAVWSLCLRPDKNGFVSGSADHSVKFWSFNLVDDEEIENQTKKRLTFTLTRTLKLDDDVLCVRISPNGRLLAVALLDSTVKVFFMDTLKLYLNLYGHKQPVLSMDISYDNKLIVTGSADRHLKVWGLDFGDCHRSLFAHEDSIMGVQFAGKTHYVFTCGKDGKLKEWDVDKFERIVTLEGHLNEIWTLCVSDDGKHVVTASHDKTMRLWERTHEPLVLEDERENENEAKYEKEEVTKEEQIIPGVHNTETGLATIKTIETIKSAERLIESLDIYAEEDRKRVDYEVALRNCTTDEERKKIRPDAPHPQLTALGDISAEQYVLDTLKDTKSSEIETTLLILDFEHVKELLEILCSLLSRNKEIELCLRCSVFLLKINYGQITSTQSVLSLVENLKRLCESKLSVLQNTIGFNLAGMKYLKDRIEENEQTQLFTDIASKYDIKKKKKKNLSLLSTLKSDSVVDVT